MNAIVIEHVKVSELPETWRQIHLLDRRSPVGIAQRDEGRSPWS